MADEDISDYEEHKVNYEMKDYMQHIFDPEPNLKKEFTPHKAIQTFVNRHFTTSFQPSKRRYSGGVWPSSY